MRLEAYERLQTEWTRFTYESAERETLPDRWVFRYRYSLTGPAGIRSFTHEIALARSFLPAHGPEHPLVDHAMRQLGLMETVNYWKLACPMELVSQALALDEEQAAWWKDLFIKGLGEFFYINGIYGSVPDESLVRIFSLPGAPRFVPVSIETRGNLIPVGGGKDSVVTMELLAPLKAENDVFLMSARKASYDTAVAAGYGPDRQIVLTRRFDPQLLRMNAEGFLNGHVPFSAILAFASLLTAAMMGRRHIVLSNEGSANEPTVPDTHVNHQYSKSLEFESDFTRYAERWITPSIRYFSLLRPWSEARIAQAFAGMKAYHPLFLSCNRGSKDNIWCCDCPKCLFVYILTAAFAGIPETTKIFGAPLLDKISLRGYLEELLGLAPTKPFECVGTVAETFWCLNRITVALEAAGEPLPELVDWFRDVRDSVEAAPMRLVEPESAWLVPESFRRYVLTPEEQAAARLHGRRIAILGFGAEGRSTLKFLRRIFPEGRFIVADSDESLPARLQTEGEDEACTPICGGGYLERLAASDADLVFRSPGVPLKDLDALFDRERLSSQTELFLDVLRDRTVGITGTKGKSTTASLVFEGLKAAGADAALIGNIGRPVLDSIVEDVPGRLYVFEMSSHMLETASVPPRTAVLLNVYEEHLDHYRGFRDYYGAKLNILRGRRAGDGAVIGAQALPFLSSEGIPLDAGMCVAASPEAGAADAGNSARASTAAYEGDAAVLRLPDGSAVTLTAALPALHIQGAHNRGNALAALAAVWMALDRPVPFEQGGAAAAAMAAFRGLEHRLEPVAEIDGVRWINDSISTIPHAAVCAAAAVPGTGSVILGGMDRGIDYEELIRFIRSGVVHDFIMLPATGHRLMDRIGEDLPEGVRLHRAENMTEAVAIASRVTRKGEACILSPAAASYGWYRNFEDRGRAFKQAVAALASR